ncbi:DUF3043 domain-containing protein [Brachybacterium sp. GPGPB12]|uniref:DUF3043 domain-containing protein n=1 Tax=Brachybacterium sp. GPGPB12 TaxID=3023517 RepID=UPI0031342E34
MIFRKSEPPHPAEQSPAPSRPGTKGRPTRTRKEAEAARRRPLVVDDRKEARKRDRERASQERMEARQALVTGDERKMPARTAAPSAATCATSWTRAATSPSTSSRSRWCSCWWRWSSPLIRPEITTAMSTGMIVVLWGGIALCVIDSLVLRRSLRAKLTERFGSVGQGLVGYGIMRAIQIRRFRLPKPQIKHGEAPR